MEAAAVDRPITPARPVDVATVLPGIHRQARLTTRLHPRPGNPGPQDSSLGGPLAWPAGEAWPICPVPQEHALFADRIHPREPLPMVPVLQLFARDVPDAPFPDDVDLLQLLWCPAMHEPADMFARPMPRMSPVCQVLWRSSATLGSGAGQPEIGLPWAHNDFVPRPCTVQPERVEDYPHAWELGEDERAEVQAVAERHNIDYFNDLGPAPGSKVGGWVSWDQDPEVPVCELGHEMIHLATIASVESWSNSWTAGAETPRAPAELMIGDCGGYFLFTCVRCPHRPVSAVTQ